MGGICMGEEQKQDSFPALLETHFPHMIELASCRKTVFGEVFEDPPRCSRLLCFITLKPRVELYKSL